MADLTRKQEWQNKMWRYYLMSPSAKEMAIDRVTAIAFRNSCWDWDDNVPVEWARDLARQWELGPT